MNEQARYVLNDFSLGRMPCSPLLKTIGTYLSENSSPWHAFVNGTYDADNLIPTYTCESLHYPVYSLFD